MTVMWNKDIYEQLEKEFGREAMGSFSLMVARMYDYMYQASSDPDSEYSYEATWWWNKHKELTRKAKRV